MCCDERCRHEWTCECPECDPEQAEEQEQEPDTLENLGVEWRP